MQINHYDFGCVEVEGKVFTSDVIIYSDKVKDEWWRKEGHRLNIKDLDEAVSAQPQILIVGTGYYGNMVVPQATEEYLESRGIEVRSFRTRDAVDEYNRLQQECARIVAALHLTC